MSKVKFNVSANTARLIGRENISNITGAIIELIKNTYDADATVCILYYEKSTNSFYITDNGHGMTEDIIQRHWMTIGYSSKSSTSLSKNGRVPTGDKGIGRFSLDRIARQCTMYTKSETETETETLLWSVNWDDFDKEKLITEVEADLIKTDITEQEFINKTHNPFFKDLLVEKFKYKNTGTIFHLEELHDEWDEALISKIKDSIKSLIPFEMKDFFDVYFFEEETLGIETAEIIEARDDSKYDYKIKFSTNDKGTIDIIMHRNEFDFGNQFDQIIGTDFNEKDREYFRGKLIETTIPLPKNSNIGQFSGVFYYGKQGSSSIDKEKYFYKNNSTKISKDNKTFSGIKVYRDHFRVRPYGDYGSESYDWLNLSIRKNVSPSSIAHPITSGELIVIK